MNKHRIVSIIGAGPAGLSASIQLSRFGIDHFIFEMSHPGGLLRNGNLIENYTGVYNPVSGFELSEMMIKHFENSGQDLTCVKVDKLEFDHSGNKFLLSAGSSAYYSDFVIAASGTIPVKPEILQTVPEKLKDFINFEIIDIKNYSGKDILIVGSGDCAFDYSLSLSGLNKVVILNRSAGKKALRILKERVAGKRNIVYRENETILNISKGETKPLKLEIAAAGRKLFEEYDLLVFAVGRSPNDDFMSYINRKELKKLVNRGRLLLAGDIRNGELRQSVIAAGNGVESAMKINQSLNGDIDGCCL